MLFGNDYLWHLVEQADIEELFDYVPGLALKTSQTVAAERLYWLIACLPYVLHEQAEFWPTQPALVRCMWMVHCDMTLQAVSRTLGICHELTHA